MLLEMVEMAMRCLRDLWMIRLRLPSTGSVGGRPGRQHPYVFRPILSELLSTSSDALLETDAELGLRDSCIARLGYDSIISHRTRISSQPHLTRSVATTQTSQQSSDAS